MSRGRMTSFTGSNCEMVRALPSAGSEIVHFDLKLVGGTLIDGTGAPRRRADVGIVQGKVAEIGLDLGSADEVIDVSGLVVAPGFVDSHTHLDVQMFWDPALSATSWHGVTTVVTGNCGFGFAPVRRVDREQVVKLLHLLEEIEPSSVWAGLGDDWGWESFSEYMDVVESRGVALNVVPLVPLSMLMIYVMGDDAFTRPATQAEIALMEKLLDEALARGAGGLSFSRSRGHFDTNGRPMPARGIAREDVERLARVVARYDRILMCSTGPGFMGKELGELQLATGVRITYAAIVGGRGEEYDHRLMLKELAEARAAGANMVAQVSCIPVTGSFTLKNAVMQLPQRLPSILGAEILTDLFDPMLQAESDEQRHAVFSDPTFQAEFQRRASSDNWTTKIWGRMTIVSCPDRPELAGEPIAAYAASLGVPPSRALIDLVLASGFDVEFAIPLFNSNDADIAEILLHEGTMLSCSDAGAHARMLCDARFTTWFLEHWVRELGLFTLEEAVRMITAVPADLYGLEARGRLLPGNWADIVVFDPDTVGSGAYEVRHDLPGANPRVVYTGQGIDRLLVNGQTIREGDVDIPVTPGRIGMQPPPLATISS